MMLGGVSVAVTDAAGNQFGAPLLYVPPRQINLLVPDGIAPGNATFTVSSGSTRQTFTANVQSVAPTLFSIDATGSGVAAATAIIIQAGEPGVAVPGAGVSM